MTQSPEPEVISFLDDAIIILDKALTDLKALRSRAASDIPILHNTNMLINKIADDVDKVRRAIV